MSSPARPKASQRLLLVVVVVALAYSRPGEGATTLVGTIDRDRQLTAGGNPHKVDGRVTIASGATLRVGPGVNLTGGKGSRLDVKTGAVLRLLGTQERPITFTGVGFVCEEESSCLAKYCRVAGPCEELFLSGRGEGRRWFRDCAFATAQLRLDSGDGLRFQDCKLSDCVVRGQGMTRCTYPTILRCAFSTCRVNLLVVVGAKSCRFKGCDFSERTPPQLGSSTTVYLSRPVAVRTCTFCDKSWQSIQDVLRRASFPDKPLKVERAPSPKGQER